MHTETLESFSKFHDIVKRYDAKFTIYRGVLREEYNLRPRIGRPETKIRKNKEEKLQDVEDRMLRWFKDRAIPYLNRDLDDDWEWLALAQHHNLPTRFLDWTRNPLVAAYFAVEKEYTDYTLKGQNMSGNSAIYVLKWGEGYLISKYVEKYERGEVLAELYESGPIGFPYLMKYAPPHFDMNIVVQSSIFTIHPDPKEEHPFPSTDIEKLIIPKELRREFKKTLNTYGINQLSLFPGLDSLGKQIAWLLTERHEV